MQTSTHPPPKQQCEADSADLAIVTYHTPDQFPMFLNGDVVIQMMLGTTPAATQTFQLHSKILALHSLWLKTVARVLRATTTIRQLGTPSPSKSYPTRPLASAQSSMPSPPKTKHQDLPSAVPAARPPTPPSCFPSHSSSNP